MRGERATQSKAYYLSTLRRAYKRRRDCARHEHPDFRKPDQIIQPYNFGEDASKRTCLWLKNLPPLVRTRYIEPRIVNGKPRWANQTDSGQNRLGPSADRATIRGTTYQGIGNAMASQWERA